MLDIREALVREKTNKEYDTQVFKMRLLLFFIAMNRKIFIQEFCFLERHFSNKAIYGDLQFYIFFQKVAFLQEFKSAVHGFVIFQNIKRTFSMECF